MAQESGVSGKGNAQIPKPRTGKNAEYRRMGNIPGKKYGADPHKEGPK
jgi:hypothetical protein